MDTQESPFENEEAKIDRKELLAQQFDEAAGEQPVAAQSEATQDPEPEVEEPIWKRPPSSWKRDYHEVWQTADDKLKEYAWQREEEMRKGVEPLLGKAQFADKMQRVMQPYEQTIRGLGMEPEIAVEALMRADYTLRTAPADQKRAYLAQLASQYGINLGEIDPYSQPGPVDPAVYQLQNELNNIRGEVVGWKQQQEQAQNQALQAEINDFAQTADHFEDVRPTMISLLQGGVATTLEEAYEKAIRLDDNIYSEVQKGRQAQDDVAKRDAANKAAKAAKAAAVSVRSSTPGGQPTAKAQDRRSMLFEQFDNMNERF
jgi:hypothetical protein